MSVLTEKNGISARFLEFFNKLSEQVKHKTAEVDANLHVTERAAGAYQQADEKVHLSDRAKNVWRVGKQCELFLLPRAFKACLLANNAIPHDRLRQGPFI